MDDSGKAKPKKTEVEEIGCNKKAAEVCPVQCIKIEKV
jgi:ferredoxin